MRTNFVLLLLSLSALSAHAADRFNFVCGGRNSVHRCLSGDQQACNGNDAFDALITPKLIQLGHRSISGRNLGHRAGGRFKGFEGKAIYRGATLYAPEFGYNETYRGNGIEDGEAVIAADRRLVSGAESEGLISLIATDEDGDRYDFAIYCRKIDR